MENRDGLETAKKDATAREQQLWTAIKAITSRVEHAESRAGHAEVGARLSPVCIGLSLVVG